MDALIKETNKKNETANQLKIIYLKRIDENIEIKQDIDFDSIQLDLNVIAEGCQRPKSKVTVYTED